MKSDINAIEQFNIRRINRLSKRTHFDGNVGWAYGLAKSLGADVTEMEPKEVFEYIKKNRKGTGKTSKEKTKESKKVTSRKTVEKKTGKRIGGFPMSVSSGEDSKNADIFTKSVKDVNPIIGKVISSLYGLQPTIDIICINNGSAKYSTTENRIYVPSLEGKDGKEKDKCISSWIHEIFHAANHSQEKYDNGKETSYIPKLQTNTDNCIDAWNKEKIDNFGKANKEIRDFVEKAKTDIEKRKKRIVDKAQKEADKIKKKIPKKPKYGDPNYAKDSKKYSDAWDKAYNDLKKLQKDTDSEIENIYTEYPEECMIMNMYDALTKGDALDSGDVCYGHGREGYYSGSPIISKDGKKDDGLLERNEMLSIYAQMLYSNGEALKLFKKYNPLISKEFENIIKNIGNNGENLKERSDTIDKIINKYSGIKIDKDLYWYSPEVIEGYASRIETFKKKFPEMDKVIKELSIGDGMFGDPKYESGRIKIDRMHGFKKDIFNKTEKGSVKNSTNGDRQIGDLFTQSVLERAAKLKCKKSGKSYRKVDSMIMAQDIMKTCEKLDGGNRRKDVSMFCKNGTDKIAIEECITDVLVNGTKANELSKEVVKEIRKRLK